MQGELVSGAEGSGAQALIAKLSDPVWRLSNLYKISTKSGNGNDGHLVVTFKPNSDQQRFLDTMWYRNVILKVRQLGFTTLISLLWLDTAMFAKSPVKCGTVAQTRELVEELFRDKILFAYDNLPPALRERFPLSKRTGSMLVFAHNGASVKFGLSMRSATLHRLHISEYGKICAQSPFKAREVQTGAMPTVPLDGLIVIESTAEGIEGDFYRKTQRAIEQLEKGSTLNKLDYRLHFASWYTAADYRLDDFGSVQITPAHAKYFFETEAIIGVTLSPQRCAWYVATLENQFGGDFPTMWQEYPSYPQEAFRVSAEGCYFAVKLAEARVQGRITAQLPVLPGVPVNTFWDIGRGDMTAIWFHQRVGVENRFIGYLEGSGEDLAYYVALLQKTGHVFGRHFLPHDAALRRMGVDTDTNKTIEEMLQALMPGQRIVIVPRISNIAAGIQAVRNQLAGCWFDETACAEGLKRVASYRKRWDRVNGRWSDEPVHDDASHGTDALRGFAQAAEAGETFGSGFFASAPRRPRPRTSAMAC